MNTNELRKAAQAVFLATDEKVAQDLSDKLNEAAHEIDKLRNSTNTSEAIYSFAGWLTSREKVTIMSAKDDAAPIAELVDKFCKANNYQEPRNDFARTVAIPNEN